MAEEIKEGGKFKKRIILRVFKVFLFLFSFLFVFILGFGLGISKSSNYYELINKDLGKPQTLDFSLYWEVWDNIHKYFLNSFSDKNLFYSSIKGLVAGLNDPYSQFLNPDESKIFSQDMEEEFSGIGVELTKKDGKTIVVAPLKGGEAEKSGIKPLDEIVAVNGEPIEGLNLTEVLTLIRGKENTEVVLTIKRQGEEKTRDFKIKRYKIKIESLKWKFFDNIAYIQISQFSEKTKELADKAVKEIIERKPKGIILDLRHNPGGYFESAIDIASLFIENGPIVYERNKEGTERKYEARGDALLKDYKVVVLIDSGSASASEILAGALKDYNKATIVGEKSFGKGVLQNWESFKDGSSLVLTIARWLTPKKAEIDKQGVVPDIKISSEKTDCSLEDKVCFKAKELINK